MSKVNWDIAPSWAREAVKWEEFGPNDYILFTDGFKFLGSTGEVNNHGDFVDGDLDSTFCEYSECTLVEKRPEVKLEQWLPKVGEPCEISNCGQGFKYAEVLFLGESLCVVNHTSLKEQHYHLSSVKFRPSLKPNSSDSLEAFKQAVVDDIHKDQGTYFDRLDKVATILFNNDFKAPRADNHE